MPQVSRFFETCESSSVSSRDADRRWLRGLTAMQRCVSPTLSVLVLTSFAIGQAAILHSQPHTPAHLNFPVVFEANAGQLHPDVKFSSRLSNYRVSLRSDEAVFIPNGGNQANRIHRSPHGAASAQLHPMRLHMIGSNPDVSPQGKKELPSYSNYLIGNNPQKWRTHVPQFAEVSYDNIYPGIDLIYYSNDGKLEYDLVVSPNADPSQIKFSITGSELSWRAQLNHDGDLVLPGSWGNIVLHKPVLYQGKGCSRSSFESYKDQPGCKEIDGGGFRLQHSAKDGDVVSFRLPPHDHGKSLIIDPTVVFSTFLGGSMGDGVQSLAVDAAGYIYLLGDTNSPDFPVTSGSFQGGLAGDVDAFVTKLSPDGSHILWSTYLGGSLEEFPRGIAVDAANSVYVTGLTYSTDFPLVNPYQTKNLSGAGFVSKLSPDGSSLIYSTFLTGTLNTYAYAIAVDGTGEAVVVGATVATDFPVVNAFQPNHADDNGSYDAFLSKFSADGRSLVFSTYLGGDHNDYITGVALDSSTNVYVTGATTSTDFPTTPGSYQPEYIPDPDNSSFISKFSPSGTSLIYSTYLVDCLTYGIAINESGNAFVTGLAAWFAFPVTPGAFQTTNNGGNYDAFVTELNAGGSSLVYSTYLGGFNADVGFAIALDSASNAYVTGITSSQDFPLQSPLQKVMYPGVPTIFVSELNNFGSALVFSTYWGGGAGGYGFEQGNAMGVDKEGSVIVAGSTEEPDFPVVKPIQAQMNGLGDGFIAKFQFPPDFVLSSKPQSLTIAPGQTANYSILVTPQGGFNKQVSFSCSGAPLGSSCSVSPSVVTLDGVDSVSTTVTVKTTAQLGNAQGITTNRNLVEPAFRIATGVGISGVLFAIALCIFGTVSRRRIAPALIVLALALCISCGGGGGSNGGTNGGGGSTPPGTYTITVRASSGSVNHNISLTLILN